LLLQLKSAPGTRSVTKQSSSSGFSALEQARLLSRLLLLRRKQSPSH